MRCSVPWFVVLALCPLAFGCSPDGSDGGVIPAAGGLQTAGPTAEPTVEPPPSGIGGLQEVVPAVKTAAQNADRYWTKDEVEGWVRQDLKLTQVALTAEPDHAYRGTGIGANGRSYTLRIEQIPGGIKCWFQDDFGGSGSMAFGKMAEEPKPFVAK